jgi:hypothetical protein
MLLEKMVYCTTVLLTINSNNSHYCTSLMLQNVLIFTFIVLVKFVLTSSVPVFVSLKNCASGDYTQPKMYNISKQT